MDNFTDGQTDRQTALWCQ